MELPCSKLKKTTVSLGKPLFITVSLGVFMSPLIFSIVFRVFSLHQYSLP